MAAPWAAKFYNSKAWRSLRERLIVEANFLCAECGESYLRDSTLLVGHHVKELTPANVNDASVSLNPDNIKIICRKCHEKAHRRFGYDEGQKVYLVYGAPCSGKSTYVNQLARRGDLIVDLDAIYSAISVCQYHEHLNSLKRAAFAVRDTLLEQIRLRVGYWHDAYVVGGYPRKLQREQLAARIGAELVYVETTRELAKATAEMTRGTLAKQWQGYIDDWFDAFEA